jgi:hypothetical protein
MANIPFSGLLEMYTEGNLTPAGFDKWVRAMKNAPTKSTVNRALNTLEGDLKDSYQELVDAWIEDELVVEGASRGSKPSSGFYDADDNACTPSFYMKGSKRNADTWTQDMKDFKTAYEALVESYVTAGKIVNFS